MMRTLHLLRHATPTAGRPGQGDFDRPLAAHGRDEAAAIGRALASLEPPASPRHVLCSPSRRTLDTLAEIAPFLAQDLDVERPDALYCASRAELLDAIASVDPEAGALLVIAHNPGIAVLAHDLAAPGTGAERARLAQSYPPCTLATLGFECASWAELIPGRGQLLAYRTPD